MKTIFRSTIATLLFAAIMALGAAATFAQDPCADAEGIAKLDAQIRELLPKKGVDQNEADRRSAISLSKQFLEKYGACESTKEFSTYLTAAVPKLEKRLADYLAGIEKNKMIDRFNTGIKGKNWDEVYAAGKDLLAKYPDEFRVVEVVMGSIGLDETQKSPRVTKWNDETIRYAKASIADLEAGKLKDFGVKPFIYLNKDDAIAWMNYTIGYILTYDKNNKKEAAPFLYKAAQASASETRNDPVVYQAIGVYYFDTAKVLIKEYKDLVDSQKATDTDEVKQQKVDAIKAKGGMLNGTVERALDAYSRAWALAKSTTPAEKTYRDGLYKTISDLYNVRFEKLDGLEAWVKAVPAKPMPDPTSAVTPVIDPEPATTSTTTPPTTTPAATPAKPATTVIKPTTGKPQSVITDTARSSDTTAAVKAPAKAIAKKKGTR